MTKQQAEIYVLFSGEFDNLTCAEAREKIEELTTEEANANNSTI